MLESPTPDRKATVLLLLAVAGCVDAVGLGETGRYFVSYMSGNMTQAGVALAYGDWPATVAPIGLVALFVAGATLGAILVEKARHAVPALLIAEAVLLALAALAFGGARPMTGVVLLPVAMGLANIVAVHGDVPYPGVTYATGTLVRLGVGLAGLGRDRRPGEVAFNAAMAAALLGGAVAGALGRLRFGTEVLVAPAGALLLLGGVELAGRLRRGARAPGDHR